MSLQYVLPLFEYLADSLQDLLKAFTLECNRANGV